MTLEGKNVLLIAPSFFGYEQDIISEIERLKGNVIYVNANPGKIFSSFINGLRHFHLPYSWLVHRFENQVYLNISNKKYDIVFVICGWAITSRLLLRIKNNVLTQNGKMYLYYWDSISLLKDDITRWLLFDRIFTFDQEDYQANSKIMNFLPLFYNRNYHSIANDSIHKYNLATIGSFKYDRYFTVERLKSNNSSINIFSYLYINRWEFYLHKIRKKYRNVLNHNLTFKKLGVTELMAIYSDCDAILDMPRTGQNGQTMRVFECLAMNKKIVTTNEFITTYDFYNPNNIYVLPLDSLTLPSKEWFQKPYEPLKERVLQKYSIQNWLNTIFS